MSGLAIYVHVPYCVRKCAYCDFNAYSGADSAQVDSYTSCVIREIERSEQRGRKVSTIFFGGGTPTYLSMERLRLILDQIRSTFEVDDDAEISSEANPSTVDSERFREMFGAGFNRLSIGVQSFDDRLLKNLDRTHTAEEAVASVKLAMMAGFLNLSIDLMFGLPAQTPSDWISTLECALSLEVPHLSVYALTLEPGTRFERLHAGGKLSLPGEDAELEMYETAIDRLSREGYEHYEVSNFAKLGFRSRHNVVYWQNEEYAGFGPGAVSYVGGTRWTNEPNPALYTTRVNAEADLAVDSESLDEELRLSETLIQGLRMRDGVELSRLTRRSGIDVRHHFSTQFRNLEGRNLIERKDDRVRLTHAGLLLANDVALELLP